MSRASEEFYMDELQRTAPLTRMFAVAGCGCDECNALRNNWQTPGAAPPSESEKRKATPVWAGVLRYFPDAVCAVARLSKAGNDKHNPGEALRWSRDKSSDHGDCLMRHQLTPELPDEETGELHAVAVAWRALAQLQILEEARLGEKALAVQLAVGKTKEAA